MINPELTQKEAPNESDLAIIYQELMSQKQAELIQSETNLNRYVWMCFVNMALLFYLLINHVSEQILLNSFMFNVIAYGLLLVILIANMGRGFTFFNLEKIIKQNIEKGGYASLANVFSESLFTRKYETKAKVMVSLNTLMVCLQFWVLVNMVWMCW